MYITINNTRYPCTGYSPRSGAAVFYGVAGLELPISGRIAICDDSSGFVLDEQDAADFSRQIYEDGVLTLTNEPAPPEPTAEELLADAQTAALARIDGKCSAAIMSGVMVGGKHYRLSQTDQLNLNAALSLANSGVAQIPFAATGEALTMYSAEEIKAIGAAAYQWGLANQIYYGLLQAWIARETDATVLNIIDYGSTLPDDLMATLAQLLAGAGIDAGALVGLLG